MDNKIYSLATIILQNDIFKRLYPHLVEGVYSEQASDIVYSFPQSQKYLIMDECFIFNLHLVNRWLSSDSQCNSLVARILKQCLSDYIPELKYTEERLDILLTLADKRNKEYFGRPIMDKRITNNILWVFSGNISEMIFPGNPSHITLPIYMDMIEFLPTILNKIELAAPNK
ncbi:MAG: hypothetical protein C0417_10740 [Chlorobiaceae bacterium]|nr:hypothetical protein [Chlorobiaceae bacterium]